jgi:hypothetical protein
MGAVSGCGALLVRMVKEVFFFEKKNQKTFAF